MPELNRRPEGTDRPEQELREQRPRGLAEPGRHLTNAPVERFRWSEVELDPPEWAKGVDRLDDLPDGEELTEPDPDKTRRTDKIRQVVVESYDEVSDASAKIVNAVDKMFGPRPDGQAHTQTRPDRGPVMSNPHLSDVDAGSVASALLTLGIVAAELTRRVDRLRGSNQK
ncbi:MAG: hypothetical protein GEV11_01800 [Streptosporangiales bacterium]|nr:hypothetical protein [Streptosporangiales bacterium]